MAQQHLSNASLHKIYEGDDQEKYTPSDVSSAASKSGINTAGYKDKNKILNELHEEADQEKINERLTHDPTYAATMHGNKPSRGAKVDAQLQQEDAEMIAKKNTKTHSSTGKMD